MIISFFKFLLRNDIKERAEREQTRFEILSSISPEDQIQPDNPSREKMIKSAQESVRRLLDEPTTATFSDFSFYSRGVLGFVVCGKVESVNPHGAVTANYFATDLLPSFAATGSEICASDPRTEKL